VNVGDPVTSSWKKNRPNKSKPRVRRGGKQEVRLSIVLLKQGNACGGKGHR